MDTRDYFVIVRDLFLILSWIVALVFLFSGLQDVVYDIGAVALRLKRKSYTHKFARLSLARLRARDQQRIALMVPAWNEGEVVGAMVRNIIDRVEYKNYFVFVGVYPNDAATQNAVDRLAAVHPRIIKVVNPQPGPTTKADCLNNVFRAIKQLEETSGQSFDIIVMHDAEDNVHPQSFLLYNYLLPRVDAIQLPILPLPTRWTRWTHWNYADEFAETHMKDVPVREKLSGFVPYAGVGTGFSRRTFAILDSFSEGEVFNERSMTEDYSMSLRIKQLGLTSIFVNVILADDKSKWFTPLVKRPGFISNWAYFPMDFTRSVRQKTRWIIGISLQEWETIGWKGGLRVIENLIKDRKVFAASAASMMGYVLVLYFTIFALTQIGIIKTPILPVIVKGTPLYFLTVLCTYLMLIRATARFWYVTKIYGIGPGFLAVPRLLYGNIINGLAAFRAVQAFARSRRGRKAVKWDATTHYEGVGSLPAAAAAIVRPTRQTETLPLEEAITMIGSSDPETIVHGLDGVPSAVSFAERERVIAAVRSIEKHETMPVRAAIARLISNLVWPEFSETALQLVADREWTVRSNAARAIVRMPNAAALIQTIMNSNDRLAKEIVLRTLEADTIRQRTIMNILKAGEYADVRANLARDSDLLRSHIETPTHVIEG